MFNFLRAFGVTDGIRINESLDGPFITGGASSPVGQSAPIGTIYLQPIASGFSLWEKFASSASDWRVKEFVAKSLVIDSFQSLTLTQTTSLTPQLHSQFQSIDTLESGSYQLSWSFEWGQSDKQKRVTTTVQYKPATSGTWINASLISHTVGFDNTYDRETGFLIVSLASADKFDIRFLVNREADGGTARMRNTSATTFKVT